MGSTPFLLTKVNNTPSIYSLKYSLEDKLDANVENKIKKNILLLILFNIKIKF